MAAKPSLVILLFLLLFLASSIPASRSSSVWHVETYGNPLSPLSTGDALDLSNTPIPADGPSPSWSVHNRNGSFPDTTLDFSSRFVNDQGTSVANVSCKILNVFTLGGTARFANTSAGIPTEIVWETVDGTNANGNWIPGPSSATPRPKPDPGNHDCHEVYNAEDCARVPTPCSWCQSKDGAHELCFIDDKDAGTGLDSTAWTCEGEGGPGGNKAAVTSETRTGNSSSSSSWAVIIVGSKGFENYRHHADACHTYKLLRSRGVAAERILLLMQDDVVNSPGNTLQVGKLFNSPLHGAQDVYAGCFPTYTGPSVDKVLFADVLTGSNNSGKAHTVLESTAEEDVLIYYVDHGGPMSLTMPNGDDMTSDELNTALATMREKKMYNNLIIFVEACFSGSMFASLPSGNTGTSVRAVTAANANEESHAVFCPPHDNGIGACLGDAFSVAWLHDVTASTTNETLGQQTVNVRQATTTSHVSTFGDDAVAALPVSQFEGQGSGGGGGSKEEDERSAAASVRGSDVPLVQLFYRYLRADEDNIDAKTKLAARLMQEIQSRERMDGLMRRLRLQLEQHAEGQEPEPPATTNHDAAADAAAKCARQAAQVLLLVDDDGSRGSRDYLASRHSAGLVELCAVHGIGRVLLLAAGKGVHA